MAQPEEAFETVIVATRYHVDMQMRDTLADAIVDRHKRAFCSKAVLQRTGNELGHRKQGREECLREIKQRGVMRLGDNHAVSREKRATIHKGERVFVLPYNIPLAFAGMIWQKRQESGAL